MPYQEPNGRWRAVKKIAKRRKQKIFRTKAEAKKWEAEQTLDSWLTEQTPMACLFDAADAYLTCSQVRHHSGTYADKKNALKYFFSYVPAYETPDKVSPDVVLKMFMDKARSVSNASANKLRKHLAAFWQYASKYHGWPQDNPFATLDKLPENSVPHYVPPAEDFWKVYTIAGTTDKVMLLALLYTACRRSEVFRWTWEDDIDLVNHRIRLSTCKTKDGSRKYEWMQMPEKLHAAFVAYREDCSGQGHVFRSQTTGEAYVDRKNFIIRLCKRAGVKQFNYHGIRGLCATLLAQNNVPLKQIQGVLMHSSITTTDRYIRSIGGVSDELVRAFENFEIHAVACKKTRFKAAS